MAKEKQEMIVEIKNANNTDYNLMKF